MIGAVVSLERDEGSIGSAASVCPPSGCGRARSGREDAPIGIDELPLRVVDPDFREDLAIGEGEPTKTSMSFCWTLSV